MNSKKVYLFGWLRLFSVMILFLLATSGCFMQDFLGRILGPEVGGYILLEVKDASGVDVDDAIQQAVAIISSRLSELDMGKSVIQREGERQIRIDVPKVKAQAQAMEIVKKAATQKGMLTFVNQEGEVLLTGANLANASFTNYTRNSNSVPLVTLEFDDVGRELFARATETHMGEIIYIYLDDELLSYPTVRSVISDGTALIEGFDSAEEAINIAMSLRFGVLPVELEVLEIHYY